MNKFRCVFEDVYFFLYNLICAFNAHINIDYIKILNYTTELC
jgi:hypothetical protein